MTITVSVSQPSVVPSITTGAVVSVVAGAALGGSAIGASLRVSVANIDDPSSEMAALGDSTWAAGTIRIATQDVAGANAYRIYVLDLASSTGQSTPNRIDRTAGGQWVLVGGKGVAGSFAVETSATVGTTLGVAGDLTASSGTAASSTSTGAIVVSGSGGIGVGGAAYIGGVLNVAGAATLTTASSGLTIAKTSGTTLVVSSTDASTSTASGCATFAGGIGVAGSVFSTGATVGADATSGTTFVINGAAATNRGFAFRTAGTNRWLFQYSSAAESGSDAGSNFQLLARADGGGAIDTPLSIVRASGGAVTITRPVSLSTASTGLTIAATTGTTLVSSSTTASTSPTTGAATFAGGVGINGAIYGGDTLTLGTSAQNFYTGATTTSPRMQIAALSTDSSFGISRWSNSTGGTRIFLGKSRGTSLGSHTVVQSGDVVGSFTFNASDGSQFQTCAEISVEVDAGAGAGDTPGRIIFRTTPDGSAALADRLTINSAGRLTIADAGDIAVGTTTGTKIGTGTTQKLGFWNATPVVQPASANQAALTDSTGGTASTTFGAITAGAAYAQADMTAVKNALAQVVVSFNAIRTALVNTGIIKGSA